MTTESAAVGGPESTAVHEHEGEGWARGAFFALGVGNLFAWNAFITAAPYYQSQFCGQPYEASFLSYFSTIYTVAQPLGLLVNVFYHNFFSIKTLVRVPLWIYTAVFVITTLLVTQPSIPADSLFGYTLVALFVVGFVGSIMNGGLFALAGVLPPAHTASIMTGQGMAGFIVALVQLMATGSGSETCSDDDDGGGSSCESSDSVDWGDFAYFLVACIVLSVCSWLFYILWNLPFIVHCRNTKMNQSQQELSQVVRSALIDAMVPPTDTRQANVSQDFPIVGVVSVDRQRDTNAFSVDHVLRVARLVRSPAYSVFMTYCATLMVYPSVMVQITPVGSCHTSRFLGDLWLPTLFLFYNFGDLAGRMVAGRYHHQLEWMNASNIHFFATARLVLPIMFLFCHVDDTHTANLFNSDAIPPLLVLVLGLTNGFVANQSMMLGPSLVASSDAPLAGTIMTWCLVVGLLAGATISFLLLLILTGTA